MTPSWDYFQCLDEVFQATVKYCCAKIIYVLSVVRITITTHYYALGNLETAGKINCKKHVRIKRGINTIPHHYPKTLSLFNFRLGLPFLKMA